VYKLLLFSPYFSLVKLDLFHLPGKKLVGKFPN